MKEGGSYEQNKKQSERRKVDSEENFQSVRAWRMDDWGG